MSHTLQVFFTLSDVARLWMAWPDKMAWTVYAKRCRCCSTRYWRVSSSCWRACQTQPRGARRIGSLASGQYADLGSAAVYALRYSVSMLHSGETGDSVFVCRKTLLSHRNALTELFEALGLQCRKAGDEAEGGYGIPDRRPDDSEAVIKQVSRM